MPYLVGPATTDDGHQMVAVFVPHPTGAGDEGVAAVYAALRGALMELARAENWEQDYDGSLTSEQMAEAWLNANIETFAGMAW